MISALMMWFSPIERSIYLLNHPYNSNFNLLLLGFVRNFTHIFALAQSLGLKQGMISSSALEVLESTRMFRWFYNVLAK